MNHFKCPYDPLTCDHSSFFEEVTESGKVRRWVECSDSYQGCDLRTGKINWFECESFYLITSEAKVFIKKGDLCVDNPSDWWAEHRLRNC